MNVLVVDDALDLAVLTADLLRHYGHHATARASDFNGLLDLDAWDGVDAALVDLALGEGVDGYDLVVWMDEHVPRVRVVVLTGHDLVPDKRTEGHVVLGKPATVATVLAALEGR